MARTADDVAAPQEVGSLDCRDPATHDVVGKLALTPSDGVAGISDEMARIQRGRTLVPLGERLRVLARAADDILDRADQLAPALTRKSGKTVVESYLAEVGSAANKLSWAARHGLRHPSPQRIPNTDLPIAHKRHWFVYRADLSGLIRSRLR